MLLPCLAAGDQHDRCDRHLSSGAADDARGIYVWARLYTPEWKKLVESRYGTPPAIEYLHSPVMVDNRDGTISVAA